MDMSCNVSVYELQDAISACKAMFEISRDNAKATGGDVVIDIFYISHALANIIVKTSRITGDIIIDQIDEENGKYVLRGVKLHPEHGLKVTLIESEEVSNQKELKRQWNL